VVVLRSVAVAVAVAVASNLRNKEKKIPFFVIPIF
jgi:hypothetical protein